VILTENKFFSLKIHCRGWAAKRLNHARIIESLLYWRWEFVKGTVNEIGMLEICHRFGRFQLGKSIRSGWTVATFEDLGVSEMQGVSKRDLQQYSKCYCVASVTKMFSLKGVQAGVERWIVCTPLSINFFVTLNTLTFGKPLWNSFWNTLHYQWKSQWIVTVQGKTWYVLLHYDSSKHCIYILWINLYKLSIS
jgi:hypothetical protein